MSEARRSAARGIPWIPTPLPTREARERAERRQISADRVGSRVGARRALRVRQMVERAEKAAICAMAEGGEDDEAFGKCTSVRRRRRGFKLDRRRWPVSRASTRLRVDPPRQKTHPGRTRGTSGGASSETEDGRGGGAAAKRRAAEEARAMSRRRARGPGEEAFYERLNEARKSREDLGGTESRSRSRSRSLPLPPPRRRSEDPPQGEEKATDARAL